MQLGWEQSDAGGSWGSLGWTVGPYGWWEQLQTSDTTAFETQTKIAMKIVGLEKCWPFRDWKMKDWVSQCRMYNGIHHRYAGPAAQCHVASFFNIYIFWLQTSGNINLCLHVPYNLLSSWRINQQLLNSWRFVPVRSRVSPWCNLYSRGKQNCDLQIAVNITLPKYSCFAGSHIQMRPLNPQELKRRANPASSQTSNVAMSHTEPFS